MDTTTEMHFGHGAIVQRVKARKLFLVVASVEDKGTWEEKGLYRQDLLQTFLQFAAWSSISSFRAV